MYVDTSTRPDYLPTRRFYERNGYTLAASLPDFYDTGDGKAIYCKVLEAGVAPEQNDAGAKVG